MYGLVTTVGPSVEPVTPAEAKLHARIDLDAEDALVSKWIKAAREYAETHTGRALANRTLKLTLGGWPSGAIELPVHPVASVTSVKYYSTAGVQTTLIAYTDYQTWLECNPALIAPAPKKVWPIVETNRLNTVEVVFVAGYGAGAGWPAMAEQAIFLTLTYWNRNRGDGRDPTTLGMPEGAIRLLDSLWTGAY